MPDYTLADTWLLNNRVNLMLLDRLSDDQLQWGANPRARTVADQFAHLHNVRLTWLEVQSPAAAKKLRKIEKGTATKTLLREALEASAAALAEVITAAEAGGKLKSVKRGVVAFFGYMLAHEGHHRGQIILHLKNAKMPIDPTFGYALWDWQKI